ncbi:MAG: dihydrodipicolinate synthase family protein [Singulisphaera sp.]
MTTRSVPLAGVLPVFQTPYFADESIDFDTLDREIDWLLSSGARGVVMAMVSETLRLSTEERRAMAERVCHTVADRAAAVISVGAESTHAAVELARHAERSGATALMAIPPVATSAPADELLHYYRALLQAVTLPVIVQDASGYVGRPLPVAMQARLLDEYGPARVMFKPEAAPLGPNLTALREATGGRARVFEGSGGVALVDSFRRGVVGTMPGAELIRAMVALWGALEHSDNERVYRLSLPIAALVNLQTGLDGFLAVEKYLLVKQGIFQNTIVRGPLAFRLDDETRAEVDRLFELVCRAVDDTSD